MHKEILDVMEQAVDLVRDLNNRFGQKENVRNAVEVMKMILYSNKMEKDAQNKISEDKDFHKQTIEFLKQTEQLLSDPERPDNEKVQVTKLAIGYFRADKEV